jgi:Domain of unknown function (DUF6249)
MFHGLAGAIVAVSFWAFLAVAAFSGIRYDFRKRQIAVEALRAAIEHGQSLDPALVERLLDQHHGSADGLAPDLEPNLQVAGIITLFVGVGIAAASMFVGVQYPVAKFPMIGGGILVFCIGVGLLIAARVVRRYRPSAGSADRAA